MFDLLQLPEYFIYPASGNRYPSLFCLICLLLRLTYPRRESDIASLVHARHSADISMATSMIASFLFCKYNQILQLWPGLFQSNTKETLVDAWRARFDSSPIDISTTLVYGIIDGVYCDSTRPNNNSRQNAVYSGNNNIDL